mmetsp:Transcript_2356/g.5258  ORF Transcript_2356/g.5258 Transcript_2356/m.5258 type:complete len:277 (-) Transcript_2356:698-1528(-)
MHAASRQCEAPPRTAEEGTHNRLWRVWMDSLNGESCERRTATAPLGHRMGLRAATQCLGNPCQSATARKAATTSRKFPGTAHHDCASVSRHQSQANTDHRSTPTTGRRGRDANAEYTLAPSLHAARDFIEILVSLGGFTTRRSSHLVFAGEAGAGAGPPGRSSSSSALGCTGTAPPPSSFSSMYLSTSTASGKHLKKRASEALVLVMIPLRVASSSAFFLRVTLTAVAGRFHASTRQRSATCTAFLSRSTSLREKFCSSSLLNFSLPRMSSLSQLR